MTEGCSSEEMGTHQYEVPWFYQLEMWLVYLSEHLPSLLPCFFVYLIELPKGQRRCRSLTNFNCHLQIIWQYLPLQMCDNARRKWKERQNGCLLCWIQPVDELTNRHKQWCLPQSPSQLTVNILCIIFCKCFLWGFPFPGSKYFCTHHTKMLPVETEIFIYTEINRDSVDLH